jgi:hypothetical protein
MDIQPLTRLARPLAACVATVVGLIAGCTTTKFATVQHAMTDAMKDALQIEDKPPPPATEFACLWSNRRATLPDPTKNGAARPGIVGQIFLNVGAPNYEPAEVEGELTITVHDITARPPGAAAMTPEAWHFTKDALKKMGAADDRFGRSLVVFLPWPDHWHDVNCLYIQGRYDQPNGHTLWTQPATVTLDFTKDGGPNPLTVGLPAVPDPAVLLKQAQAARMASSGGPTPAGFAQPAPQQAGIPNPPNRYTPPNYPAAGPPGMYQQQPPAGYPQYSPPPQLTAPAGPISPPANMFTPGGS